jgi:tropomyosin
MLNDGHRLRQTDVKAGHYERKVQALEAKVDEWEQKYEEIDKKYKETKDELDRFAAELGSI